MPPSGTDLPMRNFSTVAMIGQGGYAIVRVVKHKATGRVYALKQIAKGDFHHTNQLNMAVTEADILYLRYREKKRRRGTITSNDENLPRRATRRQVIRNYVLSEGADYFPDFYGSWQDDHFIYFLMEYLPGGDLMKHLMDLEIFPEVTTKFYIAQLAIAVGYLHDELGYAHRDLKPDNILFDSRGYIKLLDFGLSRALPLVDPIHNKRLYLEKFHTSVGTPDYMAPEVHRHDHFHTRSVDWWSLGIIMYEMLYGGPPLTDRHHRPEQTARLIRHWKEHMRTWPATPEVSAEAKDLMMHLIAEHDDRFKCVEDVLSHPWFNDIDIVRLRQVEAPIIPRTDCAEDVRNFDSFSMSKLLEWEKAKMNMAVRPEVANALATKRLFPVAPPSRSMPLDLRPAVKSLPGQFTGALRGKISSGVNTERRKAVDRGGFQTARNHDHVDLLTLWASGSTTARAPAPQYATQPNVLLRAKKMMDSNSRPSIRTQENSHHLLQHVRVPRAVITDQDASRLPGRLVSNKDASSDRRK